jgi:hypothetical protein
MNVIPLVATPPSKILISYHNNSKMAAMQTCEAEAASLKLNVRP